MAAKSRPGALEILIVEDETVIAADLRDILEQAGHTVLGEAASMAAALALAARRKPQVAIVDIELEGGHDGLETAQVLGSRYGTPVLFLTGRPDFLVRAMALTVEPLGHVAKPYRPGDILEALRPAA